MTVRQPQTTARSDEGLAIETSALYGGQFTLSTQLIKLNYIVDEACPFYGTQIICYLIS